jgi:hypothetical protein
MDFDIRTGPTLWGRTPGTLDIKPGAAYKIFFYPGQVSPTEIVCRDDGTVDCGPGYTAVTEGGQIIGFNRQAACS